MPDPNVALIHRACAAYESADTAAMLNLIDPYLEWTYLDPSAPTRTRRSATAAASWKPHSHSRPTAACVRSWRR
jgi:hypothetical protein